MPELLGPEDSTIVLKFGGGIHSRPSEEDIDQRECSDGTNFELDLQNFHFRRRKPFQFLGQAPNQSSIRGFATLKKASTNQASLLVQAGDTVYEFDGTTFTSRGSVSAGSRLRGRISHNWQLSPEVVLITDLTLTENVKQWDGTTLADVTFTDELGGAFGDFKAKYCVIQNERAIFGNVIDATATALPQIMIGSKVSDYTEITVTSQPSSALGEDDPFFITTPDLRPINGMVSAFTIIALSTQEGQFYQLVGASAKDFAFKEFYPESGASGDESVSFVGNDIFFGRPGRVESLTANDKFGDVENNDLSVGISDLLEDYDEWHIEYSQRTQKVYCYQDGKNEIWVFYKPLRNSELSPWSKMTTSHFMNMDPSALMRAYSPEDGLEYIYFGDTAGNLYRMDIEDPGGDGGLNSIRTVRESALFRFPGDTESFVMQGWVKYRKPVDDITLTLIFRFQGHHIYRHQIDVTLKAPLQRFFYSDGNYYSGGIYYGSIVGEIGQEIIGVPGKSTEVQIEAILDGKADFSISEIGLRFTLAK